jgi:hypothetical protein
MPVVLHQQLASESQGKIFGVDHFVFGDEFCQIKGLGYLYEYFSGVAQQNDQPAEQSGSLLAAEKKVPEPWFIASRAFAEKHQMGNNVDGAVDGALKFNQKPEWIGLGFDKAPVESVFSTRGISMVRPLINSGPR